ncbi:MAG: low-complexity protein [Methylophaga sp.]|nr:low-complexity protein [Methylophaga sp.]
MKNKIIKTTVAVATSTILTAGLALSPLLASADTNPFSSAELSSGYLQLAEGKCGGNMKKDAEAKCGANKKAEGKCGEAKCGANKKKAEGKCGEGKCGAKKIDNAFMSQNISYKAAMDK